MFASVFADLCQVPPALLQWTTGGLVVALFLTGFGTGIRQGYRMGRQAQRDLEQLGRRDGPVPVRGPRWYEQHSPGQWRCHVCGMWNPLSDDVRPERCVQCNNPRGTPGFQGPPAA